MAFRPIKELSNAERALSDTVSKGHWGLGFARDRRVGVGSVFNRCIDRFRASARIHRAQRMQTCLLRPPVPPSPHHCHPQIRPRLISFRTALHRPFASGTAPKLMACSPISIIEPSRVWLCQVHSCLLQRKAQTNASQGR